MRKRLQEHIDKLDEFPTTVKEAVMEAKTEAEMVDVIGTIKAVERRYRPTVSMAVAENTPTDKGEIAGEVHRVEVGNAAQRSYNTPNLMTKMQENGITLFDLIEHGVVDMKWRWTELKNFTKRRGIDLTITDHELAPLDPKADADVGEVWGTTGPRWI